MNRYARGDDAAFAEVYDTVAPKIHAYLLRLTRDRSRAQDLLQQTLLQMHQHRGTYVAGLPVLPWAFAIARRLSIDDMRRRKTDALCLARGVEEMDRLAPSQPDEEVAAKELVEKVEAELVRMSEPQRTTFELLRVDGLSQHEAARRLDTTVGAIKLRAFRASAAIRELFGLRADGAIEKRRTRP